LRSDSPELVKGEKERVGKGRYKQSDLPQGYFKQPKPVGSEG